MTKSLALGLFLMLAPTLLAGDVLIADFEDGSYGSWQAEGEAFGQGPVSVQDMESRLKGVLGVAGRYFVNSAYQQGDKLVGKLVSPEFVISANYLNLLIGGGDHPKETCLNVLVDGSVIASLTGGNRDYLQSNFLDLSNFIQSKAHLEIVDEVTGRWGFIMVDQLTLSDQPACADKELIFVINKPYLILPVQTNAKKQRVRCFIDGKFFDEFDLELPAGEPDFYTFIDVRKHLGRTLKVSMPKLERAGYDTVRNIRMADQVPGFEKLYREKLRPRFHYTSRRGWLSDPNGLVHHDGRFHLYYQHNPYGWYCWNIHWGHATSQDLIHWTEQPITLYPPKYRDFPYSGSGVVDFNNTSGFQSGDRPPLVIAFTSTARGECMAYSNDGGMTFTEYEHNPVLKPFPRVYDPGIIWYEPGQHWVMAGQLNEGGEHIGFHTSPDLKEWTYQSKVPGFHSCQHIFPLPHPSESDSVKWIIHGMDGAYMIGDFDGKVFTPETDGKIKYNYGTAFVAAQSFNDMPASDPRHVSLAFTYNGVIPGMPFNNCMLFPVEKKLRHTKNGLRVCPTPIEEITSLHGRGIQLHGFKADSINQVFQDNPELITGEMHLIMRLKQVVEPFTLELNGVRITIDPTRKSLICTGKLTPPVGPFPNAGTPWSVDINNQGEVVGPMDTEGTVELEILLDRTTIEIFGNRGELYMPVGCFFHYNLLAGVFGWQNEKYKPITFMDPDQRGLRLRPGSDKTQILSFELHHMKSMWE